MLIRRVARLYDWANSNRLKAVNQAYLINQQGSFLPVVSALDKGREWHNDFPKPLLQAVFVNAVKQARSSAAAELAALSKETAAHLADAFDSPYPLISDLPSNPAATLKGASDELGRARLLDCVRLRGSFEPGDAENVPCSTLRKMIL